MKKFAFSLDFDVTSTFKLYFMEVLWNYRQ